MSAGQVVILCLLAWLIGVWFALLFMECDKTSWTVNQKMECVYDGHVDSVRKLLFD